MVNMSYCMFENTMLAMRQLISAMYEEGSDILNDMNDHERRAFERLIDDCEQFRELAEDIKEQADHLV